MAEENQNRTHAQSIAKRVWGCVSWGESEQRTGEGERTVEVGLHVQKKIHAKEKAAPTKNNNDGREMEPSELMNRGCESDGTTPRKIRLLLSCNRR